MNSLDPPLPTRDRLIPLLAQPQCPRELRERAGLRKKTVESALHRMARAGWIRCATPAAKQARHYELTFFGRLLFHEVTGSPPRTISQRVLAEADILPLRAWVQAGRYRRLVLKHLISPMSARSLRRCILGEYKAIGANHVHTALRSLRAFGLVLNDGGLWRRSPRGDAAADSARTPEHFGLTDP